MTISEKIYNAARALPKEVQQEILDYILFLTEKQKQEDVEVLEEMRAVIAENLPAFKELAK